ncbi:MAG: hypothetical protein MUF46_11345 [Desulfobacterales bacterium]|nr:hypothetical protein [Desulfobacterales bacterium]
MNNWATLSARSCGAFRRPRQIVRGLPPPARQVLLDREGRLDGSVQVMVNEEGFIPRSRFSDLRLAEGDRVRFLLLACGG